MSGNGSVRKKVDLIWSVVSSSGNSALAGDRECVQGWFRALRRTVIAAAVTDYDFRGVSRVLDVGGGLGHFVAAVLTAYPALQGAVFGVPELAEEAANYLAHADVADRCVAIGGNFFESLPAGLMYTC